ncbi:MAG: bifunctional riboflavin kinase/FAD synthetase [Chloroflexota bacterium]|nr:bifunctional riboflavin kinase/FAD synthetase [Chloroflexota bacterium]
MAIPALTRHQLESGSPGRPTALTIGVLDGVHLGHRALLQRLTQEARARGLTPGVITLHPHPRTVLNPSFQPSYLTSLEQRIELLHAAGADWVIPLTFTSEVAEVEAEELVSAFVEFLEMRLLVLGPDAAFGRGAPKDTPERMRRLGAALGFEVVQIPPLLIEGERCSSSAIRSALQAGDMERVTRLLGRHYELSGPVVRGYERGRTLGFPTANISIAADRALPALGVYATWVRIGEMRFKGATNIGRRPTFEPGHVSIETHVLDFDGDLYGRRITIELVARIREERVFASVEELREQIARDVAHVREVLR